MTESAEGTILKLFIATLTFRHHLVLTRYLKTHFITERQNVMILILLRLLSGKWGEAYVGKENNSKMTAVEMVESII